MEEKEEYMRLVSTQWFGHRASIELEGKVGKIVPVIRDRMGLRHVNYQDSYGGVGTNYKKL